jgi:tRNA-dihydrouridine synthase A
MAEPELVAECVRAMRGATDLPVTVKCRLGIDDQDTEGTLDRFVDLMVEAGVDALYVHARKAWLRGLSPKENRTIPPLDYPRVHRLAQRLDVPVFLNGGIQTIKQAEGHMADFDGVMMGRAAYHEPMMLTLVDAKFFGDTRTPPGLGEVIDAMVDYADREMTTKGARLNNITRHMLGLANGRAGARTFRQILSVDAAKRGAGPETIRRAYEALEPELELAFA